MSLSSRQQKLGWNAILENTSVHFIKWVSLVRCIIHMYTVSFTIRQANGEMCKKKLNCMTHYNLVIQVQFFPNSSSYGYYNSIFYLYLRIFDCRGRRLLWYLDVVVQISLIFFVGRVFYQAKTFKTLYQNSFNFHALIRVEAQSISDSV